MEVKAAGMLAAGDVLVGIFFTCSVCFVLQVAHVFARFS